MVNIQFFMSVSFSSFCYFSNFCLSDFVAVVILKNSSARTICRKGPALKDLSFHYYSDHIYFFVVFSRDQSHH